MLVAARVGQPMIPISSVSLRQTVAQEAQTDPWGNKIRNGRNADGCFRNMEARYYIPCPTPSTNVMFLSFFFVSRGVIRSDRVQQTSVQSAFLVAGTLGGSRNAFLFALYGILCTAAVTEADAVVFTGNGAFFAIARRSSPFHCPVRSPRAMPSPTEISSPLCILVARLSSLYAVLRASIDGFSLLEQSEKGLLDSFKHLAAPVSHAFHTPFRVSTECPRSSGTVGFFTPSTCDKRPQH